MTGELPHQFNFLIANTYLPLTEERKPSALIKKRSFTASNAVASFQEQNLQWTYATTCSGCSTGCSSYGFDGAAVAYSSFLN
jgi:hypothetical protein